MLLEFTVENYRSFYRKKTLVLEADKALCQFKWEIQSCQCDARNGELRVVVGEVK
jgi:AAA15 family ATPase/GTPase